MTKQLVLLAGLHKTGTSSIQLSCAASRGALRSAGFFYPVNIGNVEDRGNHTLLLNALFRRSPMAAGLAGRLDMGFRPGAQAWYDEFPALVTPRLERVPCNLILAAEGASLFDAPELTAMKEWFTSRGWGIRVIVHVRHLSSWISSHISQRVTGQMRLSIPAAIDELVERGGIVQPRIENLRAVFPGAEFVSHELAVAGPGGPAGHFFRNIGLAPSEKLRIVRANEGRSDCATRVMSLIFERFGRFDTAGKPHPEAFADFKVLAALGSLPGRKFALRRPEVQPVMAMLQSENAWLRKTLGEPFFDPRLEFDEVDCDWTRESREHLAAALESMPSPVRSRLEANLARVDLAPADLSS